MLDFEVSAMKQVDILTNHNGRPARIQKQDNRFIFDNFPKNPTREQALAIGIAMIAMCGEKPTAKNLLNDVVCTIGKGFRSDVKGRMLWDAA